MKIQNNMFTQNPYDNPSNPLSKFVKNLPEEKPSVSSQMRQMIRDLKKEQYSPTTNSPTTNNTDPAEEEIDTSDEYNYKTVANKIQQAKTSISAGQAVLAAKRETLKIKRKIASGSGDAEKLQLALTHAKRMEMVARRKKHHLELEELVENTGKRDEQNKEQSDASMQMKNTLISAKEEEFTQKEDAIFNEREEMLETALKELEESDAALSEDQLKELNEMISEFGEEELKELEEAMEMLETMEVVDPHMCKEDLQELKRKHRASENKAIMKANMDYLKDMIKHELQKGAAMGGLGSMSASPAPGFSMPVTGDMSMPTAAAPSVSVSSPSSIDIQI